MKIQRIVTKKLFGIFDHDIKLNNESNITIIIGENGLGKTVILEAINAFFKGDYSFFNDLEFEFFYFYLDNNEIWRLTKKKNEFNSSLFIARTEKSLDKARFKEQKISSSDYSFSRSRMVDLQRLRRMEMELDYEYNYKYSNDIDLEIRRNRIMAKRRHYELLNSQEDIDPPKWFSESIKKINIKLIETQRIITAKEIGSDEYVSNVRKCSNELKGMISGAVKDSSSVTEKLDSTYPNRLIKKLRQGTKDTFAELNDALIKLDKRRKILSSVGLVVNLGDSDTLQIKQSQNDLINVLKLYIDDSHEKLDPFEELSKKLKLFLNIINKRFKHKKLEISQERGFVFRSTIKKNEDGKFEEMPASKLSSGEQNEIILFYKLIFNSQPNDLILIDEPELSLHISWQNKFIKDLKEVTSMTDVDIVIATHSPDIIDEEWDLSVELVGIE